ncbi:MAG: DUF3099 domain-containing protein [Jatrophihabitantaceae bacterium]
MVPSRSGGRPAGVSRDDPTLPGGRFRWHDGRVRQPSRHPDRPILITEAPINVDDEYNRRRKRYLIMMTIRALCIIGAATTFTYSGWLAAAFVAAALVLPWSAVLIANDRPPKQALRFRRFLPGNGHNELPAGGAAQAGRNPAEEPVRTAEQPTPRVIDL